MSDPIRRDALARDIARRMALANLDELRVLDQVLLRLELGRQRYGFLDLSKARDWDKEAAEEMLDLKIYLACKVLSEREQSDVVEGMREMRNAEPLQVAERFDVGGEG